MVWCPSQVVFLLTPSVPSQALVLHHDHQRLKQLLSVRSMTLSITKKMSYYASLGHSLFIITRLEETQRKDRRN